MAFNLPGILGRNNRARQDMVDRAYQEAQRASRVDTQNLISRTSREADSRDMRRTGGAYDASGNLYRAQKSIEKQGYDTTDIHMMKAADQADAKVSELQQKRTLSKGFHKEEYGEDRPTRRDVRSAKKDAKALGKAATEEYFK